MDYYDSIRNNVSNSYREVPGIDIFDYMPIASPLDTVHFVTTRFAIAHPWTVITSSHAGFDVRATLDGEVYMILRKDELSKTSIEGVTYSGAGFAEDSSCIVIKHDGNQFSVYGNLAAISVALHDFVKHGDKIGILYEPDMLSLPLESYGTMTVLIRVCITRSG